jgi:hypothetical protein
MGKEHHKVATHNLDVSPEETVVLSLEIQPYHWDCGRFMMYSRKKVQ